MVVTRLDNVGYQTLKAVSN